MCVGLIQLSLSLLIMGDFWLPMDAKLWPDYWILVFSGCIQHCDCRDPMNSLKYKY